MHPKTAFKKQIWNLSHMWIGGIDRFYKRRNTKVDPKSTSHGFRTSGKNSPTKSEGKSSIQRCYEEKKEGDQNGKV